MLLLGTSSQVESGFGSKIEWQGEKMEVGRGWGSTNGNSVNEGRARVMDKVMGFYLRQEL